MKLFLAIVLALILLPNVADAENTAIGDYPDPGVAVIQSCKHNPKYPTKCKSPQKVCGQTCSQWSRSVWICPAINCEPYAITPADCSNVTKENEEPQWLCHDSK